MTEDVEMFVNACITRGRMKQTQSYSKAERQHIIADQFNGILVIDHIEPEKLALTSLGNNYM